MAGLHLMLLPSCRIIITGKMQMVHAYFSSNSFFLQRKHIAKIAVIPFLSDMQDMQTGIVFFGKLDGSKRRFKTGILIADHWMVGMVAVPCFRFLIVQDLL